MCPVVRDYIGITTQAIRTAHGTRFQGQQAPALHLPPCGKDCRCRNGIGCSNNRSRSATSGSFLSGSSGAAVLVNDDLRFFTIAVFGRNISSFCESMVLYCTISEFGFRVREPQFSRGIAFADRMQGFRPEFDVERLTNITLYSCFLPDFYLVTQESRGSCAGAAEIVRNLAFHQNLDRNPERVPAHGAAAEKQIIEPIQISSAGPNSRCCFNDRLIGQKRQKVDSIEYVRLSDSIRSGNAGIGAEIDREIDEIFEAVHFKTGQHGGISGRRFCAARP